MDGVFLKLNGSVRYQQWGSVPSFVSRFTYNLIILMHREKHIESAKIGEHRKITIAEKASYVRIIIFLVFIVRSSSCLPKKNILYKSTVT